MSFKTQFKTKLDFEDVFCVTCRCIYLQPVTMPCSHTLCLECFKNMVNITAFQCPMCRTRISNWLRKFKHDWNTLVNKNLWEAIQQQYPVEIQKRLNDEDDGIEERIARQGFTRVLNKEGEVKKEFDTMRMNILRTKENEIQNLELVKQLQQEVKANKHIVGRTQNDSRLALTIHEQTDKELQHEQILPKQIDKQLANKIQTQNNSKKEPLDKMLTRISHSNAEVQYRNKENCFPNHASSSRSNFSSNTNSLDVDLSAKFQGENMTCTCRQLLQDNLNRDVSPCQFCLFQMINQQKTDFIVAKKLEKQLNKDVDINYNLRKRSSSTHNTKTNKESRNLAKGYLLRRVLMEKTNNK